MYINNEISSILVIVFMGLVVIGLLSFLFNIFYNNMIRYLRSKFNCIDECYLNIKFNKALKNSVCLMTEIIIKNGTIYTMNPKLPKVNALAIMDGKFIYVGDDINTLKLTKKDSQIIKERLGYNL